MQTIHPSIFSTWIYSRWCSSSVLPKVARTNVFDELESDWQELHLGFCQFGSISHTAVLLKICDMMREFHVPLCTSSSLALRLLPLSPSLFTRPLAELCLFTCFRPRGGYLFKNLQLRLPNVTGQEKKKGAVISKGNRLVSSSRVAQWSLMLWRLWRWREAKKCGDVGSEPMNQSLLWSTKIIHQRRLKTGKHEKQQQNVNQGLRCEEFWESSPEGLS